MVLVVALNERPSEEGYYPRHDVKGPNRRSMRISESTISKDLSQLNQLFLWVGNHEIETFRAFGGVYRPHAYTGRKRPMSNDVIDRVYELARETDR